METRPNVSPLDAERLGEAEQQALIATPAAALSWAWSTFGERCCVLASMQQATVIELAMRVDRRFPIVFLDTGYHFAETWETLRLVERRYGINVEVIGPKSEPTADITPGRCCDDKPALLAEALAGRSAWVSGMRRHQTEHRQAASIVEIDRRGMTKLNPIAQWSDDDHTRFVEATQVIQNPLLANGYRSIGCEPCTEPPADARDARSGRWAGTERTECGLHL